MMVVEVRTVTIYARRFPGSQMSIIPFWDGFPRRASSAKEGTMVSRSCESSSLAERICLLYFFVFLASMLY